MKKRMLLCVALGGLTVNVMAETKTFEAEVVGQPPAGWTCGATGRGSPKWSIEADPTAPSKGRCCVNPGRPHSPGA